MRRRLLGPLFATAVALTCGCDGGSARPAEPAGQSGQAGPVQPAPAVGPAVFFVPHQDDDVLVFGADIVNHLDAGRQVIVVLMTDGSSTGVCRREYDYGLHDAAPAERARCTARRDREFRHAMADLDDHATAGRLSYLIDEHRQRDGSLTTAHARSLIQSYVERYPRGSFKTTSYKELLHCGQCRNGTRGPGHRDHGRLGRALQQATGSTDKRYYLKPEFWDFYCGLGSFRPRRNIDAALDDYGDIGKRSAPHDFHEQRHGPGYPESAGYVNSGGADSKYHTQDGHGTGRC